MFAFVESLLGLPSLPGHLCQAKRPVNDANKLQGNPTSALCLLLEWT